MQKALTVVEHNGNSLHQAAVAETVGGEDVEDVLALIQSHGAIGVVPGDVHAQHKRDRTQVSKLEVPRQLLDHRILGLLHQQKS